MNAEWFVITLKERGMEGLEEEEKEKQRWLRREGRGRNSEEMKRKEWLMGKSKQGKSIEMSKMEKSEKWESGR